MSNRPLSHLQRPQYAVDPTLASNSSSAPPQQRPAHVKTYEALPRPTKYRYDQFLGTYTPAPGQVPPPCQSQYTVAQGSVSCPRFLRTSLTHLSVDDRTQRATGLPVTALWQPLAEQVPGDRPIPRIGRLPYRCTHCHAYINPHFRFLDDGQTMQCNLCETKQTTLVTFLDEGPQKMELAMGTYEFIAPSEYLTRPTIYPLFFFCIDATKKAVDSGLFQHSLNCIKNLLDYIPFADKTRVGIMTFSSVLKFYKVCSCEVEEIIVADIDDPFVPDSIQVLTLNVFEDRDKIDRLLDNLLGQVNERPQAVSVAPGCVVDSLINYLLKGSGGRVILFATTFGTIGKHQLQNRGVGTQYAVGHEKTVFKPLEEYVTLAHECTESDVCVDIFLYSSGYMDTPSLGVLCSQTGGDLYFSQDFAGQTSESEQLYYQLLRILTRTQASQVVLRARVSSGLSIENYIGKFKRRGAIELEAACIDSDKSILVVLKHDTTLYEGASYYLQCVMLYTNGVGERLIRVTNAVFLVSKNIQTQLLTADQEVISASYLKIFASKIYEESLPKIREEWHAHVLSLLYTHVKSLNEPFEHVKSLNEPFEPNSLKIPQMLRFVPLFSNTSLKLPAFSLSCIDSDTRLDCIHFLISLPLLQCRLIFYPSIYSIADIYEQEHNPGTTVDSFVKLPNLVTCSKQCITGNGVYIIANSEAIGVYVGSNVSDEVINQIWGLQCIEELRESPEYWEFQDIGTEYSIRVLAIVEELKRRNPGAYPACKFMFEYSSILNPLLVEDSTPSELSYEDYMKKLHQVIASKCSS